MARCLFDLVPLCKGVVTDGFMEELAGVLEDVDRVSKAYDEVKDLYMDCRRLYVEGFDSSSVCRKFRDKRIWLLGEIGRVSSRVSEFLKAYHVRECIDGLWKAIEELRRSPRKPGSLYKKAMEEISRAEGILHGIKGLSDLDRLPRVIEYLNQALLDLEPTTDYLLKLFRGVEEKARKAYDRGDCRESFKLWRKALDIADKATDLARERSEEEVINVLNDHRRTILWNIASTLYTIAGVDVKKALEKIDSQGYSEAKELCEEALKVLNESKTIASKNGFNDLIPSILSLEDRCLNCIALARLHPLIKEYKGIEELFTRGRFGDVVEGCRRLIGRIEDLIGYCRGYGLSERLKETEDLLQKTRYIMLQARYKLVEDRVERARKLSSSGEYARAIDELKEARAEFLSIGDEAIEYGFRDIEESARRAVEACDKGIKEIIEAIHKPPRIKPPEVEVEIPPIQPMAPLTSRSELKTQIPIPSKSVVLVCREFRDSKLIGEGGFARVYLCKSDPSIAIKLYKIPIEAIGKTIKPTEMLEVFINEVSKAKELSDLGHPHIVKIIDYGGRPAPWIAMEYMAGGSLRDRIREGERLELNELLRIMEAIASALNIAHHMSVFHMDIKPENILFTANGVPKLSDWGSARTLQELKKTIGVKYLPPRTEAYSAPEQVIGAIREPWKVDVFQYGLVFYEAATSIHPFLGCDELIDLNELHKRIVEARIEPIIKYRSDLPEDIARVIMECLAREPMDRPEIGEVLRITYRVKRRLS